MLRRSKMAAHAIVCCLAIALVVVPIVARAAEGSDPTPSPSPEPAASPSPSPSSRPPPRPPPSIGPPSAKRPGTEKLTSARKRSPRPSATPGPGEPAIWWNFGYRTPGSFDTDALMAAIAEMEELGVSKNARRRAYVPFIIAGRATWTDTWGAVRHAHDDGLRPHLGQDVFCEEGTPVLAAVAGTMSFGSDSLGGRVARVHDDGGYWYYAHLSSWNEDLGPGDDVVPGDVIGYCGSTGNAVGTPPHVHFARYSGGAASNPMGSLIEWLGEAEENAKSMLEGARNQGAASTVSRTEMMLRDAFAPDLTPPGCAPDLLSDPDYPWELSCAAAEDLGGKEHLGGFLLTLSPGL